jgi:hypothetical protein
MSPHPSPYRRGRVGIGIGLVVLFIFALGVFLLPFAFPTEGAIVARFSSVAQFSPQTPGGRATAGIAIQMRNPGRLALTVMQSSTVIRTLIPTRAVRKGWITTRWDGTDDLGRPVPDGVYTLHLVATSGKKGYNASRRATVDRTRPAAPTVTATSANLGPLQAGAQCAISVTPSTYARFTFVAHPIPSGSVTGGPYFVTQATAFVWSWNGRGAGGHHLTPGLYPVTVYELSVNGFSFATPTACWIGNLLGTVQTSGLAPGGTAQVQLTTIEGQALAGNTPVILQLYRRTGTPGASAHVVGSAVGAPVATTAGRAEIKIPARSPLADLWIRARALNGTALIAIGAQQ